jgi:hypothetical protein
MIENLHLENFYIYKSILDSINQIPDSTIGNVFNMYRYNLSTTNKWFTVKLVFKDKSQIELIADQYGKSYMYMPWKIKFQDMETKTNSIEVAMALKNLTLLFEPETTNKEVALFSIIQNVFKQKINYRIPYLSDEWNF